MDEVTPENHQIAVVGSAEIDGKELNAHDLRGQKLLEEIFPNLNIPVGPDGTPTTPEAWRLRKRQAAEGRRLRRNLFNNEVAELERDEQVGNKVTPGNWMAGMMATIPTITLQNLFCIKSKPAARTKHGVSKTPARNQ